MIVSTIKQGTDEWYAARLGVVTASNFKAIITKGSGKTRANYMRRLAHEIITGHLAPQNFESAAMQRGNALEPDARNAYQQKTGQTVREVGIAYLNEHKRIAASPDGLIADEGGLEIKCPLPHTHEKYLIDGKIPRIYVPQVQGSLWVTGRKWWDFVSYAPEFKRDTMIHRIYRDESYIKRLSAEVLRFVDELDNMIDDYLETRSHYA